MSDRPNGRDLLLIAREELIRNLLPELPGALRYQALMIANAMSMAAREFDGAYANNLKELDRLAHLLSDEADVPIVDRDLLEQSLQTYRSKLGAEIRLGHFDGTQLRHREMMRHLAATAADRVAISNPKALAIASTP